MFDNRENHVLPLSEIARHADGEETIFNVVNAFMGKMYLSGRIEQMDEKNWVLLKEGVDLYKQYWDMISKSSPIYPNGRIRMSQQEGYALGLIDNHSNVCLLAVWNLADNAQAVEVNLKKYKFKHCEIIYPSMQKIPFSFDDGILSVDFSKGKMARLFVFRK